MGRPSRHAQDLWRHNPGPDANRFVLPNADANNAKSDHSWGYAYRNCAFLGPVHADADAKAHTYTAPTPTPSPTPTPPFGLLYNPLGPDRDCGDFNTWQQANDFFLSAGGPVLDRHRLDGDNDGVPCESLPGAPSSSTPTATATPSGLLYDPNGPNRDCGDFPTWRQAQDFYVAAGGPGSDRHRLDGDKDGVACESRPGAP